MKKLPLLFLIGMLVAACRNTPAPAPEPEIILPKGALPVKYDSHFYLQGTVNDSVKGNFIFDTGADGLSLDSLYLTTTSLRPERMIAAVIGGVGNDMQRIKAIQDTLFFRFGTLMLATDSRRLVTPIIQLRPTLGREADGIIGIDFLKNYIVEFNYEQQYFRILPPDSLATLTDYEKVSITERGNRIFVAGKITLPDEQQIEGTFLIDLGSGRSISLTNETALKYDLPGMLTPQEPWFSIAGGIGGETYYTNFRANFFTIGSFEIPEPIIEFFHDKKGALSKRDYTGILGNAMLERFDMIIDFPNKNLYLRPNKNYDKRDECSRTGFGFVNRTDICDGYIVNSLAESQNAVQAGLQIKDIITHIDGKALKEMTKEEAYKLMGKEVQSVLLTVQRGRDTLQINLPLSDKNM